MAETKKMGPTGPDDTWQEGDLYQVGPLQLHPVTCEEAEALNTQLREFLDKANAAELMRQAFNMMRPCPKCRFIPKTMSQAASVHYQMTRDGCAAYHGISEHVDRVCRICHFQWPENLPTDGWQDDGTLVPGDSHGH